MNARRKARPRFPREKKLEWCLNSGRQSETVMSECHLLNGFAAAAAAAVGGGDDVTETDRERYLVGTWRRVAETPSAAR